MPRHSLRWSVRELAQRSGMITSTITRAEAGDGLPQTTRVNLAVLKRTFEEAGIEFLGAVADRPGIRMRIVA